MVNKKVRIHSLVVLFDKRERERERERDGNETSHDTDDADSDASLRFLHPRQGLFKLDLQFFAGGSSENYQELVRNSKAKPISIYLRPVNSGTITFNLLSRKGEELCQI